MKLSHDFQQQIETQSGKLSLGQIQNPCDGHTMTFEIEKFESAAVEMLNPLVSRLN